MWVMWYINDSAQIFPDDQLATCYLLLITLLIQWHEKSSFLFQIKCPVDIIFPKASLHLGTVVIDWGRGVWTVSNETERLVGVKLAFVSLGWNDKVGKRTSAAEMTDDWGPIKRQSEEGMRRTAEDVAEKHMDLSWIMNSSTAIDLLGKRRWIKDPLWRSSWESVNGLL